MLPHPAAHVRDETVQKKSALPLLSPEEIAASDTSKRLTLSGKSVLEVHVFGEMLGEVKFVDDYAWSLLF